MTLLSHIASTNKMVAANIIRVVNILIDIKARDS